MHQIDYELGLGSEEEEWDNYVWTPSVMDTTKVARAKQVLKSCVTNCQFKHFCCGSKVKARRNACKSACHTAYKTSIATPTPTPTPTFPTLPKSPCAGVRCGGLSKPKVVGGRCKCVSTPTPPKPPPPKDTWAQDLTDKKEFGLPIGIGIGEDLRTDLTTSNGEEKKEGLGTGAMIGIGVLALVAIGYVMFRK